MKRTFLLLGMMLSCPFLASCDMSSNNCIIFAAVTPFNATADDRVPAPGNQVQFSISSKVEGNCPLVADQIGSWSTSDSLDTTIGNQAPTQGLATCLNATPSPSTITNTGTVRGQTINPATLTCK
jgi:hypothetical protein